MNSLKSSINFFLASFLMGLIPFFIRLIEIDLVLLTFFRLSFGFIAFLLLFLVMRKEFHWSRKGIPLIILMSALFAVSFIFYFESIRRIQIASAVFLLKTLIFWNIIFSISLMKETLRRSTIISSVIAGSGMIFLLFDSFQFDLIGCLFGIGAGLTAGLLTTLLVPAMRVFDEWSFNLIIFGISSLLLLPILILNEMAISFTSSDYLVLAALILFGTFLPYYLIAEGARKRKESSQNIGLLFNGEIILPLIFGLFIFGESPSIFSLIGGGLVCFSILPIFADHHINSWRKKDDFQKI
ncbi:MAG TPA: hypothetical protein EYP30_07825 [Archaeoglobaceae archaeon]|nr:hypothetical protein [Archaeoglobaceae archaeon]